MKSKVVTIETALEQIKDGMTIMLPGFQDVGGPAKFEMEMLEKGVKDLTLISCDAGTPSRPAGVAKLIINNRVKKLITAHIGLNPVAGELMNAGELEVELVPMGTFAERIRCGGAGLGGFLTPTGVGTVVAEGKQTIELNGREYLLEEPLHADVAILKAWKADKAGNLVYNRCARNYNPAMAMAADLVIVQAENIVEVGELDPDAIMTPGVLVDMIVHMEE
ncbi:MAG: 3-oxoacid CoA-transferase subunit A [Firmicutes bacterium]|nr:3-oxoacid CoA-transferase subunit A [Bacillota bacterium]MBR1988938.1 3-oxoacid CoA-transferase subunit A [Bacillota bacterium]MBR3706477.1 3-oxoacid CoA-transferase subunit A [Bacillota bacterium]